MANCGDANNLVEKKGVVVHLSCLPLSFFSLIRFSEAIVY